VSISYVDYNQDYFEKSYRLVSDQGG
jgi:hypothetical protein